MRRRLLFIALACAAALALAPAGASAAVAGQSSIDFESLVYSADPGESNRLTISSEGDRIAFDDPGATISAGRGCTSVSPSRVTCEATFFVSAELGDRDDEAATTGDLGETRSVFLSGEQGSDTLRGSVASTSLNGGPGADVLEAGAGTTAINAIVTLGNGSSVEMPDLVVDRDTINCVTRADAGTRSITIDESDVLNGDCGGETHLYTAEAVIGRGTEGPDSLSGSFYPTRLYGLGGDDRLFGTGTTANRMDGGPGNDQIESGGLLLGGDGDDRLSSAIANEIPVRQDGGPGADVLLGRYGGDRLVGGTGPDRISGGPGNDYVNARDRERDSVRCGDGRSDRVSADRADSVARDCERVSRR